MSLLADLAWPHDRAHELLDRLAAHAGVGPIRPAVPPNASSAGDIHAFAAWLEASARWAGVELEPVNTPVAHAGSLVRHSAPAMLRCEAGLLGVCGLDWRGRVRLIGPDGQLRTVPRVQVVEAVRARAVAAVAPAVDALLDRTGLTGRRRARAREALLLRRLTGIHVGTSWILRPSPHASALTAARGWGLVPLIAGLLATTAATTVASLGSWWLIGHAALTGRFDPGWMAGWAIVLVSAVPLTALGTWWSTVLGTRLGGQLKQRLLTGALRISPETIRREGVGGLLGRVVESQAIEMLALNGGLTVVLLVVEIGVASTALAWGASGVLLVALLALWCIGLCVASWRLYTGRRHWTRLRHELTGELVEAMVGHRTRLAQERPARFHVREEHALQRYAVASEEQDRLEVRIGALGGRGFLVLGLLALGPAVVANVDTTLLAVAIGVLFLLESKLMGLTGGLASAASAGVAWEQVADLYRAAADRPVPASPALAAITPAPPQPGEVLLEARRVGFRYPGPGRPVLQDVDLTIHHGDRILLLGPSGGGKSTLTSLLVGLREPDGGLLLLDGLDRRTLGDDGWRARAVAAPQFHENRILVGTLAFNLLMGRSWPAGAQDLALAREVCEALGLGPLLDRMPAGLQQMVGESGWQLSHGERSRVFLARALLQDAALVVLDESFAALDPENLASCMAATTERARTLVVVAHP